MTQRPLWDLLQPTWVDRMGAAAWDPPSLPLPDSASSAPTDGISTKPAKQMGSFSGVPQFARPMPPEWPNFIPGPAAPPQITDPEVLGRALNTLFSPSTPFSAVRTAGNNQTGQTTGQAPALSPFGGAHAPSAGEHLESHARAQELQRQGRKPYGLEHYEITAAGTAGQYYDPSGQRGGYVFTAPAFIYDPTTGAWANVSGTPDRPMNVTIDLNTGALSIGP